MSEFDQQVRQAILAHYMRQRGSGDSAYPVFRGAPVQYGNGIGDIFRALGRFLFPILATGAKTFVSTAAQGISEGQTFKDAAKGAFKPTFSSTVQEAGEQIFKKLRGGGRKRKPAKNSKSKSKKEPLYKGGKKMKNTNMKPSFFTSTNF